MFFVTDLVTDVLYLVGWQGAVGLGHVAGGEDLAEREGLHSEVHSAIAAIAAIAE